MKEILLKKIVLRGVIPLFVTCFFLIGYLFKLINFTYVNSEDISYIFIEPFNNLVVSLYDKYLWIQKSWELSPSPDINTLLTGGNIIGAVIFIVFTISIWQIRTGIESLSKYSNS